MHIGEVALDYFSRVSLHGSRVSLIPISLDCIPDLAIAGADKDIWTWMPSAHYTTGSMGKFVADAVELRDLSEAIPFTIVDNITAKKIGSTRFHYIEPQHRRLEIGVTWLSVNSQRTYINTEVKLLQMWYAFEVLGCRRVEWKADAENIKSRAAILRLGAKEEGRFRQHMLYPDGRNRDSVYFSIIDAEWGAVKLKLEEKLGYAFSPSFSS